MDQFDSIIQSKMSKLESSCSDLSKEIFITLHFINCLKKNCAKIMTKLSSVTEPEQFLEEFMNVHAFILKYQSFLSEVNCKFEILEMSEMKMSEVNSSKKALTSEVMPNNVNKSEIFFNFEIFRNLKFTKSNTAVTQIASKQVLEANVSHIITPSKNKSKKKSKTKKTLKTQSSNECISISSSTNIQKCKVSNNEKTNLPVKTKKLMDNLDKKSFSNISLVQSEITLHSNGIDAEISGTSCSIRPCSKISPSLINCPNQDDKKKTQSKPSSNVSLNSTDFDVDNNSLVKIQFTGTQSPIKDVTKKEAVVKEFGKSEFKKEVLNKTKENEIEPANIEKQLGKEYDVVIEHIKSPSEFYVSVINSQSNLLVELEKNLKSLPQISKKFYKTNENKKVYNSKEIGNYALFYSKCDEVWYRAKITNWCLNLKDDYVSIFLIDYGESKCVSIDDLQPMPEWCKKYPACIQRCHLFGVLPKDMQKDSKTLSWGKESTEKMKYLTENSKTIKIKIAPDDCYHPPTSLPVTVWLVDKGNQCVNEMLVESKYALWDSVFDNSLIKTGTSVSHFVENDNLDNWNPMKEDFESYKNSYELDINDPSAHIYGYVGKDYDRICSNFAKTGYCYKGQACRKEHKKLNPLGFTTDQEEVYNNAFNTLKVPPSKSILNVQVTCLVTYNRFCCISDASSFSFDEENLQTLLNFMNKPDNVLQMKKLLIPPSAGQIVIARYSEDHSWYRARILDSEPEKDLYRIVFVDYGNKEVVPLSDIRAIEARYLHLPFQAIQCFISGIDQNPKVPISDVMDYLNRRIGNRNVSIEVVARLPGDDITLMVNIFDENGINIGSDLIKEEYVLHKQEMIISSDNTTMPG